MNQADNVGTFAESGTASGLISTHWGTAMLAIDIDRDGDQDLIETVSDACFFYRPALHPLAIHENQLETTTEPHQYLVIQPRIDERNSRAIGAKVEVKFGQRTLTRWITAGTSHLGQEPAEAFFGLGATSQVDQVIVTWTDGEQTLLADVAANQVLTVRYAPMLTDGFEF